MGAQATDLIEGGPGNEPAGINADGAGPEGHDYGGTGSSTIIGNAGDDLLYGGGRP